MKNIIVAISGASGAIYGVKILELLKSIENIKTHLIISKAAHITIKHELDIPLKDIIELADEYHGYNDIAACISSGSFITDGMIIAPCSVKTLAEIASGNCANLISRSADVVLKERRKLILMVRETPLSYIHIKNMLTVTKMGGIVAPPLNSFYIKPNSICDLVDYSAIRAIDLLGIHLTGKRWIGYNDK
jgi:4-hydroxy-3-polyprenylbenzoate decarboxylase